MRWMEGHALAVACLLMGLLMLLVAEPGRAAERRAALLVRSMLARMGPGLAVPVREGAWR